MSRPRIFLRFIFYFNNKEKQLQVFVDEFQDVWFILWFLSFLFFYPVFFLESENDLRS